MEWLLAGVQTALVWPYLARSQGKATLLAVIGGALAGSAMIGGAWLLFGTGAGLAATALYALVASRTEAAREAIKSVRTLVGTKWERRKRGDATPS
jgi:hypothetical protein